MFASVGTYSTAYARCRVAGSEESLEGAKRIRVACARCQMLMKWGEEGTHGVADEDDPVRTVGSTGVYSGGSRGSGGGRACSAALAKSRVFSVDSLFS